MVTFPDLGDGHGLLIIILFVAVISILFQGLQAIFLGLERMIEYNVIPIFFVLLYFFGNIFALKVVDLGLPGVMSSWLLAATLTAVLTASLLWRNTGVTRTFDRTLFRSSVRIGSKGMLISLLIILLFRADVYLVRYFLGAGLTGIYAIAIVFAEMLQKVPNAAGTVLFSKIASDVSERRDQLTAKVSRFIFLITLIAVLALIFVGKQLIPFIFGERFADSYLPLVCMLPGVLAVASGSIVNTNLWGRGYPKVAVIAPATALLTNIILNLLLIPRIGLVGAGLATSVAYVLWTALISGHFLRSSSLSFRDLILVKASDFTFISSR